jgi:hypothetical protein
LIKSVRPARQTAFEHLPAPRRRGGCNILGLYEFVKGLEMAQNAKP